MDFLLSYINFDWQTFVTAAGTNPFFAMMYLLNRGGWIFVIWVVLWGGKELWLDYIQAKTGGKKEWVLLKIQVPHASEQTVKAMENAISAMAAAHSPPSWTEKWVQGKTQSPLALELVSIDGHVGFYIWAERPMRDLVEAAIFSQYPDAEIVQVDDYTKKVPSHYPDEEWDMWGTEMVPVQKTDAYPLRTYWEFEDKVSGEMKDPLASLLESFSRLGPGEQAWYQITIVPTDQKDARARAQTLINKLKGIKVEAKRTLLDDIVDLPLSTTQAMLTGLGIGVTSGAAPKKDDKGSFPEMMKLTPIEREVLEAVERKASKVGFMAKIRYLYVAKKTVMHKPRGIQPFFGSIKQLNTFHMQALKPESKHVGINGTLLWFKDYRNDHRKHHLMLAYKARSGTRGNPKFFLSTEELATMWHFPILLQVKAPSLERTTSKKALPPSNIPFADL